MHFCPHCENICKLYDDIILKKIYNVCIDCNYKNILENMNIYNKTFNNIQIKKNISPILHNDVTLPTNNVRICTKCSGNNTVFIRNMDLTLDYICKNCNIIV